MDKTRITVLVQINWRGVGSGRAIQRTRLNRRASRSRVFLLPFQHKVPKLQADYAECRRTFDLSRSPENSRHGLKYAEKSIAPQPAGEDEPVPPRCVLVDLESFPKPRFRRSEVTSLPRAAC
jgi:hypothetical protein